MHSTFKKIASDEWGPLLARAADEQWDRFWVNDQEDFTKPAGRWFVGVVPKALLKRLPTSLTDVALLGQSIREAPEGLTRLPDLEKLDLSRNLLVKLPETLTGLTSLQTLNISYNQLATLPAVLGQLTSLRELVVAHNELSALPESVWQLAGLQQLDISHNRLSTLASGVGRLTKLQVLSLAANRLEQLPNTVGQLINLRSLLLGSNRLAELPRAVGQLASLETLDLTQNVLSELPETVGQLSKLETLLLDENELSTLPETVGELGSLRRLDVDHNQLSSLVDAVGQLTNLRIVYLSGNSLRTLPETIGQLTSLRTLVVRSNQLRSLPESIGKLASLQLLSLNANQLETLPKTLGQLTKLIELDLATNKLNSLPTVIGELPKLSALSIGNNPLPELMLSAGAEGIDSLRKYLDALGVNLPEGKLLLVGEGEVGKTFLVQRLEGVEEPKSRTTHGLEIHRVSIDVPGRKGAMLNAWDFAGQEYYRYTHQLFFTAPALYLVVWHPRKGSDHVEEWIERIVLKAGKGARIIIVATHKGEGHSTTGLPVKRLREKFGDQICASMPYVDSKTGEGINELISAIISELTEDSGIIQPVPVSYARLLEYCGARNSPPFVELCDFERLCVDFNIVDGEADSDERLRQTMQFLRLADRLGRVLHYAKRKAVDIDDEGTGKFSRYVVLKPDWLSKAVGFVLSNDEAKQNKGIVPHSLLAKIWSGKTVQKDESKEVFPAEVHDLFVALMEKYDLSFRQDRMGQPEQVSLVPALLPQEIPEGFETDWPERPYAEEIERNYLFKFETRPSKQQMAGGGPRRLRPTPSSVPDRVIFSLIVRLSRYSLGRQSLGCAVHWRDGLVVRDLDRGGTARIERDGYDLFVSLRSKGSDMFFGTVRGVLEDIVESDFDGLVARPHVVCGSNCPAGMQGAGEVALWQLNETANGDSLACDACSKHVPREVFAGALQATQLERQVRAVLQPVTEMVRRVREDLADVRRQLRSNEKNRFEVEMETRKYFHSILRAQRRQDAPYPRLFSIKPLEPGFLDNPNWTHARFQITLWCEHRLVPISWLEPDDSSKKGVYDIEVRREKFATVMKLAKRFGPVCYLASAAFGTAVSTPGAVAETDADLEEMLQLTDEFSHTMDALSGFKEGTKELSHETADHNPEKWAHPTAVDEFGEAVLADEIGYRWLCNQLEQCDKGLTRANIVPVSDKEFETRWVHPRFRDRYDKEDPVVPRLD